MKKTIKALHSAEHDDIADLTTYRALPTQSISHLNPFLFLNHHGHQVYSAGNQGLPFGPHPHRGFETVTFILKGDIAHTDSTGHQSVIESGGVQWMTAGRGLVHSEVSSENFKRQGGELEILQLWINLPAKLKMTEPKYVGLQQHDIPVVEISDGLAKIQCVSGEWMSTRGAFNSLTDVALAVVEVQEGGRVEFSISSERLVFFYVVSGTLDCNGSSALSRMLIEFEPGGEQINLTAATNSTILLGHALALDEPIVAHGPFVMNTRQEIIQAFSDYQAGKFNS